MRLPRMAGTMVLRALVLALPLASAVPAHAEFHIDFDNATGFGGSGLAPTEFQIDNIALDVPNPFDPSGASVVTSRFNVQWRLDTDPHSPSYLHLIAAGIVQASGTGATTRRGAVVIAVNNATAGAPIPGATVTQAGGASQITGTDGTTTFTNIPADTAVQFTASASGFVATSLGLTAAADTTTNAVITLPPVSDSTLGPGGIRIILNWGGNPVDLDGHLTGPMPAGTDRFHIFWAHTNQSGSGATATPTDSSLPFQDVDDVDGLGPETITIPATAQRGGTYRYSVHQYTGENTLCASPARVNVYQGTSLLRSFTAPGTGCQGGRNGTGDIWTVFTLDVDPDGSVNTTPVGTIQSSQSTTSSVFKEYAGAVVESEDPAIFAAMPAK